MYSVGLDIGRYGVGWSVVDGEGRLIRHGRHHHLWGIALFDEAQDASARRMQRLARRRLARRRVRLSALQDLLQGEMDTLDPDFFARLDESARARGDRTLAGRMMSLPEHLFTDCPSPVRTGASGSQHFPIYRIRRLLTQEEHPADLRYVYLAIAHILKHRGHFLYEDEPAEALGEAEHALVACLQYLNDTCAFGLMDDPATVHAALQDLSGSGGDRMRFTGIFRAGAAAVDAVNAIYTLLEGGKVKLDTLVPGSAYSGEVCLDTDSPAQEWSGLEEAEQDMLYHLRTVFLWRSSLQASEKKSVSQEMDESWEVHRQDLFELKVWMRSAPETYRYFFHSDVNPVGYAAYTGAHAREARYKGKNFVRCTQEAFYSGLRRVLEARPDEKARAFLGRMFDEKGNMIPNGFLPLQRINLNRVIPVQAQMRDLEAILDRQAPFHSSLRENREKILALMRFRVPFYAGPLCQKPGAAYTPWLKYKSGGEGHIRPWDFEERIDLESTAEAYGEGLARRCSFIPGERVLPKHSLLYEEFELLDEINRIRINGKLIRPTWKRGLVQDVFCRYRHVTPGLIRKWLEEHTDLEQIVLTRGRNPLRTVHAGLGTRMDMEHIFGQTLSPSDPLYAEAEQIIRWSTVLHDPKIFKRVLIRQYGNRFTPEQLAALSQLHYRGWGRLSRKLLAGIKGDRNGNPVTIMDVMRSSNQNLMKAYYSKKYGFRDAIEKLQAPRTGQDVDYDEIDRLPCSPAVKRGVWTAVRVLKELTHIMGGPPQGIYIRNMREDNAGRRTEVRSARSRCQQLRQLYADYEKLTGEKIPAYLHAQLKDYRDGMGDAEYLYFLQLGRCMYSGEPIDLAVRASYEIADVIPLCLQMDTAMDNRVLVLRRANPRRGKQAMPDLIIRTMHGQWEKLNRAGLLSGSKFSRLEMRAYDANVLSSFASRQLGERGRMVCALTDVLKAHYDRSHVYGINARLTQQLRQSEHFYALGDLNDMTQVFDAFLTAHIGVFADRYLQGVTEESVRQSTILELWKRAHDTDKNGIILGTYNRDQDDEDASAPGKMSAEKRRAYLHSVYNWKDPYVTYRPVLFDGKFYRETMLRPCEAAKIPQRDDMPAEVYGGHTGAATGHIAAIGYTKKGRTIKELISVPVYIAVKSSRDGDAIVRYARERLGFDEEHGYRDVHLVLDGIRLNTEVIYEGQAFYLKSGTEIVPSRQLFLPAYLTHTAWMVLTSQPGDIEKSLDDARLTMEELDELLITLMEKLVGDYPVFRLLGAKLTARREDILALCPADKARLMRMLISCMGNKPGGDAYLKQMTVKIVKGESRLYRKRITGETITLLDRSITGVYVKKREI